ncbi:hypothetical protein KUTeg_024215 [Tegillarca granosa]|uniref:Mitochondria-eating protein C-terminal domain-containing protein n=1 Tax=Tegillarca granosa TaxID=220873 RepID=A0ABQ9DX97_TEGGR|nr:hypothetical protein KUTeg_024215 [Tegillarca granosa]
MFTMNPEEINNWISFNRSLECQPIKMDDIESPQQYNENQFEEYPKNGRVADMEIELEELKHQNLILKEEKVKFDVYGKYWELEKVKADYEGLKKHCILLKRQYNTQLKTKDNKIEEIEREKRAFILEKKEMLRSKEELLTRLSKLAGSKLTQNNPGITDLKWTDAFEELTESGLSDNEAIFVILDIFKTAYGFCCNIAEKYKTWIFKSPSHLPVLEVIQQRVPDIEVNPEIEISDEIKYQLEDIRKTVSPLFCESVQKKQQYIAENDVEKHRQNDTGEANVNQDNIEAVGKCDDKETDKTQKGKEEADDQISDAELDDLQNILETDQTQMDNTDKLDKTKIKENIKVKKDKIHNLVVLGSNTDSNAETKKCKNGKESMVNENPSGNDEKDKDIDVITMATNRLENNCLNENEKFKENFDIKSYRKTCDFASKCARLCWLMRIKNPPLQLVWDCTRGSEFNFDLFKPYMQSGKKIDFVVWPALLLYENGPLLSKGVAQPL